VKAGDLVRDFSLAVLGAIVGTLFFSSLYVLAASRLEQVWSTRPFDDSKLLHAAALEISIGSIVMLLLCVPLSYWLRQHRALSWAVFIVVLCVGLGVWLNLEWTLAQHLLFLFSRPVGWTLVLASAVGFWLGGVVHARRTQV